MSSSVWRRWLAPTLGLILGLVGCSADDPAAEPELTVGSDRPLLESTLEGSLDGLAFVPTHGVVVSDNGWIVIGTAPFACEDADVLGPPVDASPGVYVGVTFGGDGPGTYIPWLGFAGVGATWPDPTGTYGDYGGTSGGTLEIDAWTDDTLTGSIAFEGLTHSLVGSFTLTTCE